MPWKSSLPVSVVVILTGLLVGDTCGPTEVLESGEIRFTLQTGGGEQTPVYVQVTTEDNQPGWVRVARAGGQRVYLRERCDIADCGQPSAVCGAAIPIVRDISAAGAVDLTWDGMDSVLDPERSCETRQAAAPGDYVATFCYSHQAAITGNGDAHVGVQGNVLQPVCEDVEFSVPGQTAVTYHIPGGTQE